MRIFEVPELEIGSDDILKDVEKLITKAIVKALNRCEPGRLVNWFKLREYVKERYHTDNERAERYINNARKLSNYKLAGVGGENNEI